MTKLIHLIVAVRPKFMKIAPLYHALVKEVGNVNSTVACTLSAVKLGIKLAHLEAVFKVKDKKSLHRYVLLLTENIVRKESFQKQQLEIKSDIKILAESQKQGFEQVNMCICFCISCSRIAFTFSKLLC